jgi:hypothetical protein
VVVAACEDSEVAVSAGSPVRADVSIGPNAIVGDSVYVGGGSFEGTVKEFTPGRSGRLVAGEGFARGLGLGLLREAGVLSVVRSAGPLKLGAAGC